MSKTVKRVLAAVLCAALLFGAAPLNGFVGLPLPSLSSLFAPLARAEEAPTSGACGNNLTWNFNPSTYTLTISGEGAMYDYDANGAPWVQYADRIAFVVIQNGVTSIGNCAFFKWYTSLMRVTISDTVGKIGDSAFYRCSGLTSLDLAHVGEIGFSSFEYCTGLTTLAIPASVTYIDSCAFMHCSGLTGVTISTGVRSVGLGIFRACTSLTTITVDAKNPYLSSDSYGVLYNKQQTKLLQSPAGNTRSSFTVPAAVSQIYEYAFIGCSMLTSITLQNGLTEIRGAAFEGCTGLTGVTLPNSLASIGSSAFKGCTGLTGVTLPNSLASIGNSAFEGCAGLTGVTLPNSLTSIGSSAFKGCIGLTGIVIPNSVVSIGTSAFYGCTSLADLTLPYETVHTGFHAFVNTAYYNNSAHWQNGVLYYGQCALACGDPTGALQLRPDTTHIADYAFRDQKNLTSVVIPDSVAVIGEGAFQYCEMASLTIGAGVAKIGNGAFDGCIEVTQINYNAANLTDYPTGTFRFTGVGTWAKVITLTIGDSVTRIPDNLFYNPYTSADFSPRLTTVYFNAGITSIGDAAFHGCTGIANVYYPGTRRQWQAISIGSDNDPLLRANIHVTGGLLTSGACGDNLTWKFDKATQALTISGTGAMADYENNGSEATEAPWALFGNEIETVFIEKGVTNVSANAFSSCTAITDVYFGGTRQEWNDFTVGANNAPFSGAAFHLGGASGGLIWGYDPDAFILTLNGTGNMANYAAAGSTTTAPWAPYCAEAEAVVIGSGVTNVGACALRGFSALTSITLSDSVTSIQANAFALCSALTSFTVPAGVTSLDASALARCSQLSVLTVDANNPKYTAVNNCVLDAASQTLMLGSSSGLIPSDGSVTTIGNYAFCGRSLNSPLSIPAAVTSIGAYAFNACSGLTSVVIPDTVLTIGSNAFSSCGNLTGITIGAGLTGISEYAFASCTALTSIVIPDNIETIGARAFASCTALTGVTIGSGVTSIGNNAFDSCNKLTTFVIPDNVQSIGGYAFSNCTRLQNLTIGAGVTTFGTQPFFYCYNLVNVYYNAVHASDMTANTGLFYATAGLPNGTTIIVGDNVTYLPAHLMSTPHYDKPFTTTVIIGSGVTTIAPYAFDEANRLKTVIYNGTQRQWNAITIGEHNDPLLAATLQTLPHTHEYTSAVTTQATCAQEGVMTYTCECGDAYTEPIAKLPHTPTTVVTVPATCTETGLQHEECAVCRERLGEDEVIPANGHTVGAWEMAEDPTPTSTGRMCRYCTECHIQLDEMTVPMLAGTHVTGITLSASEAWLNMGETLTLTAAVTPETAADKSVLWTSSKPGVATVADGIITPVAPGVTVIIAQTTDCGYKDFCVVQVSAVTPQNGAVLDNGVVYGLGVNSGGVEHYLLANDAAMTIETDRDVIGTGTKILVMQGDTIVNEWEAVIFGDVDGNGLYDGTDAYFVHLIVSGMVSADALTDAQCIAADCNHDGVIDEADVTLLRQAGLLLSGVDQNAAPQELETNSVYLAYCSLIDQSMEIAEPEPPTQPAAPQQQAAPAAQTLWSRVSAVINAALRWLMQLIQAA